MPQFYDVCLGPIPDVQLPRATWRILFREGIGTLAQLEAVEYELEKLPGIGVTYAKVIRSELARVAPRNRLVLA